MLGIDLDQQARQSRQALSCFGALHCRPVVELTVDACNPSLAAIAGAFAPSLYADSRMIRLDGTTLPWWIQAATNACSFVGSQNLMLGSARAMLAIASSMAIDCKSPESNQRKYPDVSTKGIRRMWFRVHCSRSAAVAKRLCNAVCTFGMA